MASRREGWGGGLAPVPAQAVDRPLLLDRLDRATRKRVVLLVAPAGYGKSVLLAQWCAAHPDRRVLAIAARPTDNAVHFGRRLLRALDEVGPGVADRASAHLALDGSALGEGLQDALLEGLAAVAPVTLVIEDLENLSSPVLLDEIGQMAERADEGIGFVFVGRDDHLPKTPRLRLRDEVAEIRQDVLALSLDETTEAIAQVTGSTLHPLQVDALHVRTEGWPAGVRLAALGLRDHPDPATFIAEFAGDDRHVADYLSGEVLAVQSPEVRDFLVRTAVLDRLTGGLCDVLTGAGDGQRTLERLERASLFIRPLDDHRGWYSFHPLFRDLLRYELRATSPGEERDLLVRAAAWHLERGESDAAAEYLLQAEDWPALVALVKAEGGRYFEQGEATRVLRWMGEVPTEVLAADPAAVLATVGLHTMCGTSLAGEALLDRFESVADFDEAGAAFAATARAAWISYHASPDQSEAAAERALALFDGGVTFPDGPVLGIFTPAATRSLATCCLAIARASGGAYDQARELLAEVVRSPASPVWVVHALAEEAWIDAATGHLRSALATASRALAVAEDAGLAQHPAVAVAHLTLARVRLEQGDTTLADVDLDVGVARGRINNRHNVLSLEFAERAHAALITGRATDGLDVIARARVAGRPAFLPVVEARLVAMEARLHVLAGKPASARAALDAHDGLVTADVLSARAATAAAAGDTVTLRKVVDDWPALEGDEPASRLARGLWTAVLHERDGDRRAALEVLGPVVIEAEPEVWVRLFLDAGGDVARLLRALYHATPTSFLRRLVEGVVPVAHGASPALVEQLSERELIVLGYLPSRLSNVEIAARLYVSVNTLKTHLKNIYRKLEVTSRGEAIERAESLGLL